VLAASCWFGRKIRFQCVKKMFFSFFSFFFAKPLDNHAEWTKMTWLLLNGHVKLTENGMINVPEDKKRICLDVGLSANAPNSAIWLRSRLDRVVFGFEPNPFSMGIILSGFGRKLFPQFKNFVTKESLFTSFFPINVAVDISSSNSIPFYCTDVEGDGGQSSLHKPLTVVGASSARVVQVPTIRLESFLDRVPWDRFDYIENLKIDAQGNDLNILKGVGAYLSKRVACVTVESEALGYAHSHTPAEIAAYLRDNGFELINGDMWKNKVFFSLIKSGDIECMSEGL
jgi:hypothetical protein